MFEAEGTWRVTSDRHSTVSRPFTCSVASVTAVCVPSTRTPRLVAFRVTADPSMGLTRALIAGAAGASCNTVGKAPGKHVHQKT